jgi:hypothetical protein
MFSGYQPLLDKHRCPSCNSRLYKCQECDRAVRVDDARFTVYEGRSLSWCKKHAPSDSADTEDQAIEEDREDNCCFRCGTRVGSDNLTFYKWRDDYRDPLRCVGVCQKCREGADSDPNFVRVVV